MQETEAVVRDVLARGGCARLIRINPDEPVINPDDLVIKSDELVIKSDELVIKSDELVIKSDEPVIKPDEPAKVGGSAGAGAGAGGGTGTGVTIGPTMGSAYMAHVPICTCTYMHMHLYAHAPICTCTYTQEAVVDVSAPLAGFKVLVLQDTALHALCQIDAAMAWQRRELGES
jgi:hypothetical protein